MKDKRHCIPNLLTLARMWLCIPLGITEALSPLFFLLYTLIGMSDILDGWLARRWHCATFFGAQLDGAADLIAFGVIGWKIRPFLHFPTWLWGLLVCIVCVRIGNMVCAYLSKNTNIFQHTLLNRLTGLLLFISIYLIENALFQWLAAGIAILALLAALQESFGKQANVGKTDKIA